MKQIARIILVAVAIFVAPVYAQESGQVIQAQKAAESWLALTDAGAYSRSWDEAAALFQAAITKASWTAAVQSARSPLGSVKARKLKSALFTHTLPGAPDGEYVVIQFESKFEHKANAIETVTPLREKDGSWKVYGYYIK